MASSRGYHQGVGHGAERPLPEGRASGPSKRRGHATYILHYAETPMPSKSTPVQMDRVTPCQWSFCEPMIEVIARYEQLITELERERLVLAEKLEAKAAPRKRFADVFELTLSALSSLVLYGKMAPWAGAMPC